MTSLIVLAACMAIISYTTIIHPVKSTLIPYILSTGLYPRHIIARLTIRISLVILLGRALLLRYNIYLGQETHGYYGVTLIVAVIVATMSLISFFTYRKGDGM